MKTRRSFINSAAAIPLAIGVQTWSLNSYASVSDEKLKQNISFELDENGNIFAVTENLDVITKNTILSLNQEVTRNFTYTDEYIPFFICFSNSNNDHLIGFVGQEDYLPTYTFIQLNFIDNKPVFTYRGKLCVETTDSFQKNIFGDDDVLHNIFLPEDAELQTKCDVLFLVQNEATSDKKIISLNKDSENSFSVYPLFGTESIATFFYTLDRPFFKDQKHLFLVKDYGNQMGFYSLNYLSEERSFTAYCIYAFQHNQQVAPNWTFQFPNLDTISWVGNDLDGIYCPFQHTAEENSHSFLFKTTDHRYACVQFDRLPDGSFTHQVLAITQPMPTQNFCFVTPLISGNPNSEFRKEIILFYEWNIGYFLLSLEKSLSGGYEFVRTLFPLLNFIETNLKSSFGDEKVAWENLQSFFTKIPSTDEQKKLSLRPEYLSVYGDNKFALQINQSDIISHFIVELKADLANVYLHNAKKEVVTLEKPQKFQLNLMGRPGSDSTKKIILSGYANRVFANLVGTYFFGRTDQGVMMDTAVSNVPIGIVFQERTMSLCETRRQPPAFLRNCSDPDLTCALMEGNTAEKILHTPSTPCSPILEEDSPHRYVVTLKQMRAVTHYTESENEYWTTHTIWRLEAALDYCDIKKGFFSSFVAHTKDDSDWPATTALYTFAGQKIKQSYGKFLFRKCLRNTFYQLIQASSEVLFSNPELGDPKNAQLFIHALDRWTENNYGNSFPIDMLRISQHIYQNPVKVTLELHRSIDTVVSVCQSRLKQIQIESSKKYNPKEVPTYLARIELLEKVRSCVTFLLP